MVCADKSHEHCPGRIALVVVAERNARAMF
jgi:hypothetical protein